jgi:mannosyltransferase
MGLYYVLLTPWSSVSVDPAWIRFPSAVAMALAVGLVVHLAQRHFGNRVAIWTATLLVPMWGVTRFAQEARSYAFVMLFAVTAWLLFLRLVDQPSRRGWIAWGVCCAALVYSHPLAILVVASQVMIVALEHPDRSRVAREAGPGAITLALLLVPMVVSFTQRTTSWPGFQHMAP